MYIYMVRQRRRWETILTFLFERTGRASERERGRTGADRVGGVCEEGRKSIRIVKHVESILFKEGGSRSWVAGDVRTMRLYAPGRDGA